MEGWDDKMQTQCALSFKEKMLLNIWIKQTYKS